MRDFVAAWDKVMNLDRFVGSNCVALLPFELAGFSSVVTNTLIGIACPFVSDASRPSNRLLAPALAAGLLVAPGG